MQVKNDKMLIKLKSRLKVVKDYTNRASRLEQMSKRTMILTEIQINMYLFKCGKSLKSVFKKYKLQKSKPQCSKWVQHFDEMENYSYD